MLFRFVGISLERMIVLTVFYKLYKEILKGSLYFEFPTTEAENSILKDGGMRIEPTSKKNSQGERISFISYANAFPNGIPADIQAFIDGQSNQVPECYNMAEVCYAQAKRSSKTR